MEDFDVFTNEIEFSKPVYKNILDKYVTEIPRTPSGPNYESGRKLLAAENLGKCFEAQCAYYLCESASASLRTLAVYRDEQIRNAENKLHKITDYVKPIKHLIDTTSVSKEEEDLLRCLSEDTEDITKELEDLQVEEELPYYKQFMRIKDEYIRVHKLIDILDELPKEWTIIQLSTPYNPNENLKPWAEYRDEISSIYVTLLKNEYLDGSDPITIEIPANVTKEGEKPLFTELYSILEENFNTIDNAQFLNNKKLVQNYWNKREDVDLRMKSVISVMNREWLGGWVTLLSGAFVDPTLRKLMDRSIDEIMINRGLRELSQKQKTLLCNVLGSAYALSSKTLRTCLRKILMEHDEPGMIRIALRTDICEACSIEFLAVNELCETCQSTAFENRHNVPVDMAVKMFANLAASARNSVWDIVKEAKRHPVILIVDEMLDSFPWESLPILSSHQVSRIDNIHILYSLYKTHEKRIVDGYYWAKTDVGRYVINPEKNLDRMELRMSSFIKYWCPSWTGYVGEAPAAPDFLNYITDCDFFFYCGHGDGLQLASGPVGGGGRSVVLLAGCGSVRLLRAPGRAPPAAAHQHLHLAACPLVLGMLWEVTDVEVDKLVSALVSRALPTAAPVAWRHVGKANWSKGQLDTTVAEAEPPPPPQPLVLLAASRARTATAYAMIASSLVARGLPVWLADSPPQGTTDVC